MSAASRVAAQPGGGGRFITLEGGEGVGKSTQIARLADALRARGHSVVTTREPGGSPGAEAIRTLLLDRAAHDWAPRAEALLFAAARADHLDQTILPALARGAWVLCDRYVDSTRAYQADEGEHALSDADIVALHAAGCAGVMPDRTLLLTLPADAAAARRSARDGAGGDRFEVRDAGFHARVAARFARIAAAEPERVRSVAAEGDVAGVTAALLAALDDLP